MTHTYKIITACKNWQRGSGWYNSDVLDETEITLDAPIPEDYLDDIDNFDCLIDDLPETSRQHDGDDEEILWIVSAYELDEDGEPAEEPAAQASRWEWELWAHFRPNGEVER